MVRTGHRTPNYQGFDLRQVREIVVDTDYRQFQKIVTAITEHTELLALLCFRQPMSGKEIRAFLGTSKRTFHTSIKRLIKVGVVIKISFEHNTLYLVNGEHTQLIRSILDS